MISFDDQGQIKALIAKLKQTKGELLENRDVIEQMAVMGKNIIYLRTLQGKDVNGSDFPAYTPGYSGAHGKTTVNLVDTGTMLNAMTQKVLNNTTAMIYFLNITERNGELVQNIAKWHNTGAGKQPQREFFGLNDFDFKEIAKKYQEHVKKILAK